MKRLLYAALVLGILGAACGAASAGKPGLQDQPHSTPMPSPGMVTVAKGADFGKAWKITASWDATDGWCVDLVGGWGACSVSTWRDGDGLWIPDADVRSDEVVVGAVPDSADQVVLRLRDGRELHARIYPVPEQLPAPFLVYKVAVPKVRPGVLVVLGADGQELTRAGFSPP